MDHLMFDLDAALRHLVEAGGSDLHLKVPSKPLIRLDGELVAIPDSTELNGDTTMACVRQMLDDQAKLEEFAAEREVDFAYAIPGLARFRVNAFYQRGSVSLVIRAIPINIMTIEDLNLPPVIRDLADEERGIVLLTGTTGSGKSTTLAAMIDHINSTKSRHIVTMCLCIVALMWRIIAASVVDLPEPVVPVHRIRPRRSSQIFSSTGGSISSRIVWMRAGMTRSTKPTAPRCWKTLQRNRPRPGTE